MTDFTKGILAREFHTACGVLCGRVIGEEYAQSGSDKPQERDAWAFALHAASVIACGAVTFYIFSDKKKWDKIRFALGLAVGVASAVRAQKSIDESA